jgi:hypothetical protein
LSKDLRKIPGQEAASLEYAEVRAAPGEGKGIADAMGNIVNGRMKALATRKGESVRPGTRAVAVALARNTKVVREHGVGRGSATEIVFVFIPADNIVNKQREFASAVSGYAGSSKDFYYRSLPGGAGLQKRAFYCACDACLKLAFHDCPSRQTNPISSVTIELGCTTALASVGARQLTLDTFCASGKVGDKVAVRIDASEQEGVGGELFWIGKVVKPPAKLKEAEKHAGEVFNRGWFVIKIRWFNMVDESEAGFSYTFNPRAPPSTLQANSVIFGAEKYLKDMAYSQQAKQYVLPRAAWGNINRYCAVA